MSTAQTGPRDSIGSCVSMVYHRLSFEDDLFTAKVIKGTTGVRDCNDFGN